MHLNIDETVKQLHDKKVLTIIVQKMLLNIWEAFIDQNDNCHEADELDLMDMGHMVEIAHLEAQLDQDYEQFAEDAHDHDTTHTNHDTPNDNPQHITDNLEVSTPTAVVDLPVDELGTTTTDATVAGKDPSALLVQLAI
jgi:hypothetical protein